LPTTGRPEAGVTPTNAFDPLRTLAGAAYGDPVFLAGGRMDIHKPKPWHGFREFLKEYLIIVVGVLTALAGEQLVETLHWSHKVANAEVTLRHELADDVGFAAEQQALNGCSQRYTELLEAAIVKNKPDVIAALHREGTPSRGFSWRSESWTAALDAQIPDHLSPERLQAYSQAFRLVIAESAYQTQFFDLHGQSWAGRIGHLDNPVVAIEMLKVVDQIRTNERARFNITRELLAVAKHKLGIAAPASDIAATDNLVAECDAMLKAVPPI
jgi:hypothetical protein